MDINEVIEEIMTDYYNVGYLQHMYGPDFQSAAGLWDAEARAIVWAGLHAPEGNFLTFGAFLGASDVLLGLVKKYRNNGHKVISVDIKHQDGWFRNVHGRARLNDWVHPIDCSITKYKYSTGIKTDTTLLGLVMSDSWHSHRAVMIEWGISKTYMQNNGIYLFHDCAPMLPNKAGKPPVEMIEEANNRHKELMSAAIPEIDPTNKTEYHASEANQDFLIELAIAKICGDNENVSLLELPEFGHVPRFDRTGGDWVRGSTSPYFSLRAVRV